MSLPSSTFSVSLLLAALVLNVGAIVSVDQSGQGFAHWGSWTAPFGEKGKTCATGLQHEERMGNISVLEERVCPENIENYGAIMDRYESFIPTRLREINRNPDRNVTYELLANWNQDQCPKLYTPCNPDWTAKYSVTNCCETGDVSNCFEYICHPKDYKWKCGAWCQYTSLYKTYDNIIIYQMHLSVHRDPKKNSL